MGIKVFFLTFQKNKHLNIFSVIFFVFSKIFTLFLFCFFVLLFFLCFFFVRFNYFGFFCFYFFDIVNQLRKERRREGKTIIQL